MICYLKLAIEIKSYKYSFKSIISLLLKMSTNWSERAPDKLREIDRKGKKDSSYKGSEEYRNMLKEKERAYGRNVDDNNSYQSDDDKCLLI